MNYDNVFLYQSYQVYFLTNLLPLTPIKKIDDLVSFSV